MRPVPPTPVPEATFELWQHLARFSASETDTALNYLQKWMARQIDADNVIWIGGLRILRGAAAKNDAFLGWRLRDRVALHPDPAPYRKQLSEYYDSEHYGKLTPTYYMRSHEPKKDDHIGMDSRASMETNGRFRVHRIRDKDYLDFAKFQKTPHYERYYRDGGIADRIFIGFPVTPDHESYFMIDRWQAKSRRLFTRAEATTVGTAIRGLPQLHRRLFLGNGLLMADKVLSPMERQLLRALLTGHTETEIAASTGRGRATLHKSVLALYALFDVSSRAALVGLWAGGH